MGLKEERLNKLFFIWAVIGIYTTTVAQDFTNFGKAKLVKVNGGVSANSIFYEGASAREPFTYFLNGNINVNIKGVYNIPLTFTYSNQEFETNRPFTFNTLSLHPSYKWITTHIGQVNMTFSPYTLNGHQFSGFGIDLAPTSKPFTISAMYGRLQKEVEFNANDPQSLPAYKRLGYGFNANYKFEKFDVGLILFKAKDDETSLNESIPLDIGVTPKDNVVVSAEGNFKLADKLQLHVEIANSVITEDISNQSAGKNNTPLSFLVQSNATTQQFNAINANVSYPVANGTVGVGYERIDPDYRTLGAYFFNNDLENITVNASQSILKGKINIGFNGGLQRDDLENKKQSQLQRIVSALNIGYTPNEKLNFTGGYSNFRSFTNIKNQFDAINEVTPVDNIDTLDLQQINQNANLGIAYQIQSNKTKTSAITVDVSFQTSQSEQNNKVLTSGKSSFYNFGTGYNLGFPTRSFTISATANASINQIGTEAAIITLGPSVNASKAFFNKQLRTSATLSYNQNRIGSEKESEVMNIRLNSGYVFKKKHRFSLNLLNQIRSRAAQSNSVDFTGTLSYNYTFDNFKVTPPKLNLNFNGPGERLKITYKEKVFEGKKEEIVNQLRNYQGNKIFREVPVSKRKELNALIAPLAKEKSDAVFKLKANEFLIELHSYTDFKAKFNDLILQSFKSLNGQMAVLDEKFEKQYIDAQLNVKSHALYDTDKDSKPTNNQGLKNEFERLKKKAKARGEVLFAHRWMQPIIENQSSLQTLNTENAEITQFIESEKYKAYRIFDNTKSMEAVDSYLMQQLIDTYFKKALKSADRQLILKYIEKN